MQINLTIGIDFTKSNKDPNDPNSLHNITSKNMNCYEKAIRACGDILAYYDDDQLFPVFGFGFKFNNASGHSYGKYNNDNYIELGNLTKKNLAPGKNHIRLGKCGNSHWLLWMPIFLSH